MSCESHMEELQNFAKQLEEQKAGIAAQIQSLDAQLAQAKNSYMKVEGAQEIIAIQIKEEESKAAVEVVVPEASGD
jgi:predicted  nucleic acid-binding Zn-ribbon protein